MRTLCKVLCVSESGYYRYLRRKSRPNRDALLSAGIQEILNEHPQNGNYGAPRMRQALSQRGVKVGLRRVKRIMREHGWLHERRRRPKGLTKADPAAMAAENLLEQDFHAGKPFAKLLTDITQVQCRDGKLYISPIMDCYSGEILSLCMRDNMKKELCVDTVRAMADRFGVRGAILHSDRGSQYTSEAFRSELARQGLTQSLSGVAHCYDNARMESFFATLKKELIYRISAYRLGMAEVRSLVFRYVFVYYNRIRVYTANPGGWPPETRRKMFIRRAA